MRFPRPQLRRRATLLRHRRALLALLVLAAAAGTTTLALALPQQQGSVDLLSQANYEWQGPASSLAGSALAGLGDVAGDGRAGIAIGAPEAAPAGRTAAGSVYVVYGQAGQGTADLTALAGRGHRIDGAAAGDRAGFALARVTLAGGHPGLAIGAPYASPTVGGSSRGQAGAVYLIDLTRLDHDVDLASPDPAVVAVLSGPQPCAQAGYALAAVASGAADAQNLLVGAPGWDAKGCPASTPSGLSGGNTGAAYLVQAANLSGGVDLASPGLQAAAIEGAASGDRTGAAVAPGSGGRLLIGAPYASPGGRSGAGTVWSVPAAAASGTLDLGAGLPAGGARVDGRSADDALGYAIAEAGDFAAGGPFLALGAPQASPAGRTHAGSVFLIADSALSREIDLSGAAGSGPRIDGAAGGDEAGSSLAALRDVNGDGHPDLALGAPYVNSPTGQGREDLGAAYVLYGQTGSAGEDLASLGSNRGYVVQGARQSDEAGTAVADAGDVNGDGHADVLVGAPFAQNAGGQAGGSAYLLYGYGVPSLAYSPASVSGTVGSAFGPLRPSYGATGSPSFSITPSLPPGLSLDPATGAIAGTPVAVTQGSYTVQMQDLAGVAQATIQLGFGAAPIVPGTPPGAGGGGGRRSGATNGNCRGAAWPTSRISRSATIASARRGLVISGRATGAGCAVGGRGRVVEVRVAVARRVGRLCRFYAGAGRFSAPRNCGRTLYRRASGTASWRYTVPGPLPAGSYVVRTLAIDGAGDVERVEPSGTLHLRLR